jgi:hypothetical protein
MMRWPGAVSRQLSRVAAVYIEFLDAYSCCQTNSLSARDAGDHCLFTSLSVRQLAGGKVPGNAASISLKFLPEANPVRANFTNF